MNDPPLGPSRNQLERIEGPTRDNVFETMNPETPSGPEDYSDLFDIYCRWVVYTQIPQQDFGYRHNDRKNRIRDELDTLLYKYIQEKYITDKHALASLLTMIDKMPQAYNAFNASLSYSGEVHEPHNAAKAQQFKQFVLSHLPPALRPPDYELPARRYTDQERERFRQYLLHIPTLTIGSHVEEPLHTQHLCALLESLHSRISTLEARRASPN